ncbi:hypothetical protein CSW70_26400, partial [Shigella sonnei]
AWVFRGATFANSRCFFKAVWWRFYPTGLVCVRWSARWRCFTPAWVFRGATFANSRCFFKAVWWRFYPTGLVCVRW